MKASEDGVLKSEVFAGLWLDVEALMKGDLGKVMAAVDRGVGNAEHARFVGKLR